MPKKIDPEVQARAVRLLADHLGDYSSLTAASAAVANQVGVGRETAGGGSCKPRSTAANAAVSRLRIWLRSRGSEKLGRFTNTCDPGLVAQIRDHTVTGSLSNLNIDVDYTYDTDGRLTGANAASGTDYTYEYDNVGNITKEQGSSITHYGYDRAGQLCWKGTNTGTKLGQACPATPAGNTTVTHDATGNSTGSTGDTIAYNDHDQVTTIGGMAMTYRDLGNDLRLEAVHGSRRQWLLDVRHADVRRGGDRTTLPRAQVAFGCRLRGWNHAIDRRVRTEHVRMGPQAGRAVREHQWC